MSEGVAAANLDAAFAEEVASHNVQYGRSAFRLTTILFPVFVLLDFFLAPRDVIVWLVIDRAVAIAVTGALFLVSSTPWFRRHHEKVTAGWIVFLGLNLSLMTMALGGLTSPYYAGLNLVQLGSGLLFLWAPGVSALTQIAVVLAFALCNAASFFRPLELNALVPLFFLSGIGLIVSRAQVLNWWEVRGRVDARLQVHRAQEQLRAAAEEIKLRERFKSRFFANMTHELKTPLAMILSPVELMIEGELGEISDGQRATLRSVYRNGTRLLKLIGDLLDLSRLEESRLRLRIEQRDLVEFLRALVQQVAPLAERKQIALEFKPRVPEALVWCDLDRLERVYVNLLSNAARFTPVGGHIEVGLDLDGDRVRTWVQDDGPGFPPEVAERLFERFYQVESEGSVNRADKSGTGIGLALARELVDLHGGEISASSAPGEGARFTVLFRTGREHFSDDVLERRSLEREVTAERRDSPMADFTRAISAREEFRLLDVAAATERRVVERDADESTRQHTVLVVEDTADIARLVHLTLRQRFRVLIAPDGQRGLEMARRERPDVIVTDLMMPVMDGLELTRAIRADDDLKQTPIVMLTARGDMEDRLAGVDTGVNAYLTKPFSSRELLSTVRNLTRSTDDAVERLMRSQMSSLETVAGGLAHEINNPLNYIKQAMLLIERDLGALDAASASDPASEAVRARMRKMVETSRSGVKRIGGTVALMQRYAREGFSRVLQSVDMFALCRDAAAVVGPATGGRARIELDVEGVGLVHGVTEELQQVVSNLIQNAIEACPEREGRVRVRGVVDADAVVLTVEDNGPGVPVADRQKIFRPFYTTKSAGRGMGMGLSIVWRVVEEHRGQITVGDAPGGGALFTLRLPRAVPADDSARLRATS